MQSGFRIFRILGAKMCLSRLYGAIWGIIWDDFVGISGIEALVLGETNAGFSNCLLTGAALEGSSLTFKFEGWWTWFLSKWCTGCNYQVQLFSLNRIFDVTVLLATALWHLTDKSAATANGLPNR